MSDLGLVRYRGYADLDAAAPLKARLAIDQADHVKHGIHLIVVQSADGSLVVGDSHHYAATPDPFSHDEIDALSSRNLPQHWASNRRRLSNAGSVPMHPPRIVPY